MTQNKIETLSYKLRGLREQAEIVVDRWGIPHIRARSREDVFFLQGFNVARDRLWQIDLWRKRGLGLLAADFGPGYLAQDVASRLFLYRGNLDEEWNAYGTATVRMAVERFVAGINAYIGLTKSHQGLLPPEFEFLGTQPALWKPEDVVRIRSHARIRNLISEVMRAQVVAKCPIEADVIRQSIQPAWKPMIPEGLNPSDVPVEVISVQRLATAAVTFSRERLAATLQDVNKWTLVSDVGEVLQAEIEGSNNWAISPARTKSGRPILANDPHRVHSMPSLRYIVHLTTPDIDVIGAGEPAIPGISIGHNGEAAFGLTIFPVDQEDLYVYETNQETPDQYRYRDNWENVEQVTERFEVEGFEAQLRTLKYTRHGPVVYEDPANRRMFAACSVWQSPGTAAYVGSLAYLDSKTPGEFKDALKSWGAPSVNQVYADTKGNVGWFTAGKAPLRKNWDGLLPVPGDGRYEWGGFVSPDHLPSELNPERGFVYSANEMNLPKNYDVARYKLGFEWDERSRATRIFETLAFNKQQTLEDSMRLQFDDLSIPARRVVPIVLKLLSSVPELALAFELFRSWDFRVQRSSAAGALFEIWWSKHLKPQLVAALVPAREVSALFMPGDDTTLLKIIECPEPLFPGASRDGVLVNSLVAAQKEAIDLFGRDPKLWAWGLVHRRSFQHPLSALNWTSPVDKCDVPPLPLSGSASTTMYAAYRLGDFHVTTGASFRIVMDVGNWDECKAINTPGQSGDPRSVFYRNLADKWSNGEYVPLLFSAEAVNSAAAMRITLKPSVG